MYLFINKNLLKEKYMLYVFKSYILLLGGIGALVVYLS